MILYLDSSALVKRYVAEEGSEEVEAWSAEAEALATALIARVEVPAALAKARRLGVLRADEFRRAIRAFMEDWPDLVQLPLTEALAVRAADLAVAHGLKGYDAVHLASASLLAELVDTPLAFAAFDRALRRAAQTEGLTVLPESGPPP
ncbi:type II toxin-antitoxin system VapC family toxin [Thermus islandicus]|uniref:type II toxin-antitoxin system VapC family toxin n=1 Tax=Thermus islandicus TaxID=540988 RepID=UPI0003B61B87|nr:type II toxin-antitoxin system VapC family toxin [Thermus islandicus]